MTFVLRLATYQMLWQGVLMASKKLQNQLRFLTLKSLIFTDADDYEPPTAGGAAKRDDRWEGEDEDDDVKDSWDKDSDEDDNSKGSEDSVKAVQRKKKKKLQDIIAEKEAAKMKELGKK